MPSSQKSQLSHIHRAAIVDDNITDRAFKETEVYYAGFEPIPISESFKKLEDLIAFIQTQSEAAACAHRFAHSGFCGAEVVAALYDVKFPAVLNHTICWDR